MMRSIEQTIFLAALCVAYDVSVRASSATMFHHIATIIALVLASDALWFAWTFFTTRDYSLQ